LYQFTRRAIKLTVVIIVGFHNKQTKLRGLSLQAVGLERGPLSPVSTIEELLGRNSSGSGLENGEYSRGDPLR
jgi:hypothetical protein